MSRSVIILALAVTSIAATPVANPKHDPMLGEYFEGDIRIQHGFDLFTRNGINGDEYRWPDNTVPFQKDESFTIHELDVINTALEMISSKTCIQFVPHSTENDYVYIKRGEPGSGCWSSVGRQTGRQYINLGRGCIYKGIVAHEMIHAIGFFHEQSRTDRDDYVTINWGNIPSGRKHNFQKYSAGMVYDQGVKYDYGSLMHYGAFDFSIDLSTPTIITPDGVSVGQRDGPSDGDALKIRKMYQC